MRHVGREGQRGADVCSLEIREVGKNLVLAHAAGEVVEYVVDGDPKSADARFAPAFPRLDGDPVSIVHGLRVGRPGISEQVDGWSGGSASSIVMVGCEARTALKHNRLQEKA